MAFYKAGHEQCRREMEDIKRGDTEYTVVRRHSKNFGDFLDFCKNQPDLVTYIESRKDSRSSRNIEDGDPWSGTKTYEDMQGLAEEGWPDGLKHVAWQAFQVSKVFLGKGNHMWSQVLRRMDLGYGQGFPLCYRPF